MTRFVNDNERLRQLQDDYDITGKLEEEAAKLPGRLGEAAGVLSDIGLGLVNSIFATVTILVLSLFMGSSGRRFLDWWARPLPGRPRGVDAQPVRAHRQRDRQLHGGRAAAGDDRRRHAATSCC